MVNPVNNSVQSAYTNPFQQKLDDQVQNRKETNPNEKQTQPSGTAPAQSQETQTNNNQESAFVRSAANDEDQSSRPQERGSLVDITV